MLYSNAANTITGLVTANTSCLTTNGSGVPGYTAYVSTGGSDGGTNNIVARDANGNTQFNNWTGATQGNAAVGTITLTAASPRNQVFSSGAGSAIMVLPDATTLNVGWEFTVNNNASGNITIETNGGATLFVAGPGSLYSIYLLTNSFPVGQWDWYASAPDNVTWTTAALNFGTNTNILTATWQGAAVGVAYGGTGLATTTTPYGVVCAGTSTTSALQVLNSLGSSGQLLTSNGPSALPSWQSVAGSSGRLLNVQVFTSGSGTYTATAGTNNIIVQCLAGGGGGGGAATTSSQLSAGGGGGAGGYSLLLVTGSSATYAYAVGAGGAGGAAGQNNGIVGGNSTFGTLITATGGGPGGGGPALSSSGLSGAGGAAGTSTGGNYNIAGGTGQWGYGIAGGASFPGTGGISIFGSGTFGLASFTTENGTASPANTGAGGSAGATFNSAAASGGDGGSGIIIVWEYT